MSGYRTAGEAIDEMARKTGPPAFILTACLLAIGIFMLACSDPISVLFIAPFTLGPLFFSLVLSLFAQRMACQITLIIGSMLYAAWFCFLFIDIVSSSDAQGGLALFFMGFASLPVMIPVWIMTLVFNAKQLPDKKDDEEIDFCSSDE